MNLKIIKSIIMNSPELLSKFTYAYVDKEFILLEKNSNHGITFDKLFAIYHKDIKDLEEEEQYTYVADILINEEYSIEDWDEYE